MSMLFDDYEEALSEYMKDASMGMGSAFVEDCFREQWYKDHGYNVKPKTETQD